MVAVQAPGSPCPTSFKEDGALLGSSRRMILLGGGAPGGGSKEVRYQPPIKRQMMKF